MYNCRTVVQRHRTFHLQQFKTTAARVERFWENAAVFPV